MEQDKLFDPFDPFEPAISEKEDLLQQMQPVFEPTSRLPFSTLMTAVLGMLLLSAILMPKIYLRNIIYYTSRDVAKLENEYDILRQERELLQAEVEEIRYKNQIEDTLF